VAALAGCAPSASARSAGDRLAIDAPPVAARALCLTDATPCATGELSSPSPHPPRTGRAEGGGSALECAL